MAWTYTDATGILTSAGATEAAPDSLLAGIAIVQAANAARGYRDGNIGWLRDVRINYGNSCFRFDNFGFFTFYGSTFVSESTNGGWISGSFCTVDLRTTVARNDANACVSNGGYIVNGKLRPQDPSMAILYNNTARHDWPTMQTNRTAAKIDISGIDFIGNGGVAFLKIYFGRATNFVKAQGLRLFGTGPSFQYMQTTYDDLYTEAMGMEGEGANSDIVFNRPTFWRSAATQFAGSIRGGRVGLWNATFLNNCWNRAISFASDRNAGSTFFGGYTFQQAFRSGLAAVDGVNVRYSRARQSLTGVSTWTAPNDVVTATSAADGSIAAVQLLDWYSAGTTQTAIEFFNWTAKARAYGKRTAGETVFANRVLYRASVDMSAGYSEEVQLLDVPHLALTQAQAAALTGIALAASGPTGGTITISGNVTASDLWHFYRQWISQTANFDSADSWTFDGATMNIGAWNVVVNAGATLTASFTTSGAVTNSGEIVGSYTDASGTRVTIRTADDLPLSTYLTIDGVPQAWQVGQTRRRIFVQAGSVVRIYAHAYGYKPMLKDITGNTASDYVLTLLPETFVDTTQDTTVRDTIVAAFANGTDAFGRLWISVNTDLSGYSPQEVINGLQYFLVTQAPAVAAGAVAAGSLAGFELIDGGFILRSPYFYGKVDDSVTSVGDNGIYVPLAVITEGVDVVPVRKNASGITLGRALWVKQAANITPEDSGRIAGKVWDTTAADHTASTTFGGKVNTSASGGVDLAALADAVWTADERTLTSGGASGGVTLAEIEASTVLAKEATVASRASQASVDALGTPAQASAMTALATATLTEHDATQAAIAALPAPLNSAQTQAAAAAALTAYDAVVPADLAGLATGAQVTAATAAIIAEVDAIPATDLAPVLTAIDALPDAPTPAAVADAVRARVKPDLATINDGVKLASLGIPHSTDLED